MLNIKSTYVQKSQIFLYPLLGLKRGLPTTPVGTYMAWNNLYDFSDYKFICQYAKRDDEKYLSFTQQLKSIKTFEQVLESSDGEYEFFIFDYSKYAHDIESILSSKYSKMSLSTKKNIIAFFKSQASRIKDSEYIESYLYPEKYYSIYAEALGTTEDVLKQSGELCSLIQLEREICEFVLDSTLKTTE